MRLRTSGKLAIAVIGLAAVVSLSLSAWLTSTDSGKNWVKARLEHVVSANIPGKLRIGRIAELGPPLIAEDVRFYHADGRVVLVADRAEVAPDLLLAFRGRLGFERVAVDGGRIVLSPDPDGRVAFEAAVDAAKTPGEPNDPNGGLHYALQSMHVQHFRVEAKLSDLADFKVENVEGFVGVRRIESSGTQIQLERVRGRVTPGFLGKRTELEHVDGWIHGKTQHVAQLTAATRIGSGELTAKIDVYDRDEEPVEIQIERSSGAGDLVASMLHFAEELFGDSLAVKSANGPRAHSD